MHGPQAAHVQCYCTGTAFMAKYAMCMQTCIHWLSVSATVESVTSFFPVEPGRSACSLAQCMALLAELAMCMKSGVRIVAIDLPLRICAYHYLSPHWCLLVAKLHMAAVSCGVATK